MSIRTRITLYGVGVVTIVLAAISVLLGPLLIGSVRQTQDKELAARSADAASSVATADLTGRAPVIPLTPVDPATSDEIFVLVLDADGKVLGSTGLTGGKPPEIPAGVLARARSAGRAAATVAAGEVLLRVQVRPWQRDDLGRTGFVVAAQAQRRQQADRVSLVVVLIVIDLVALLAGSVGIWLMAGRALRPLRELTAMANEIGRSTDLTRRLPPATGRDDVGRLTASFNAMMARLQEAYARIATALAVQQQFTADASHELRTPLTTIRSNAGFLRTHPSAEPEDRSAALVDIETEAGRMGRLVDDMLTLARADGGQPLSFSTVDIGALAHEVCRQARALHPDREVHCAGTPLSVRGDAESLRRLLWILLDNAMAHTADGGTIWVAVTRHDSMATLQVSDDGTGIPAGLQERVFDRFFRADPARARGGSGLGLSIARWIVTGHGGSISASNNDRGGASFVAEVPLADS